MGAYGFVRASLVMDKDFAITLRLGQNDVDFL